MTRYLLDLYCSRGGASKGYADAGFEVIGVDIEPQPNYPFDFIEADALAFLDALIMDGKTGFFDVYAGSPPCQAHTPLHALQSEKAKASYVDLIDPTRRRLKAIGAPYVIENVVQAPLENPVTLCANTFGLKLYRHRNFETNWPLSGRTHIKHVERCQRAGYMPTSERPFMSIHGRNGHNSKAWVAKAAEYMQVPWMAGDLNGVCEAIPPAYTSFIGVQLMEYLNSEEIAA